MTGSTTLKPTRWLFVRSPEQ